jgi:hypothetical protein
MVLGFQKATKGKKPARIVLGGVSGAGKTYTALTFAKHLQKVTGKRTAAIDTEHYRMSLYADKFDFDVNNFEPPFDPRTLIDIIHSIEKSGDYGTLIVDSSTHYYSGEGGLLEIVQDAAKSKYGGNQYAGWAVGTPIQNDLIDAIIRSPLHMIFCTRAKQGYAETTNEKGGKKYEKVGMELQQRDGFEFDFDFALVMDMDNNANVTKGMGYVPTGMYIKKPDESTMEKILKSINENSTDEVTVPPVRPATPKPEEILLGVKNELIEMCKARGASKNEELMKIVKSYEPSGNVNKIKDVAVLREMIEKIKPLEEWKEEDVA